MSTGSISTPIVEEALSHVFPNGVGTIKPNRIGGLDFDSTWATQAGHT
jgi:hypothetical protein